MRRFLPLIVLFLWSLSAGAERFVRTGVADGLSSRRVYRVRQDGEGYLWFLGAEGMDRYDGLEFRHYPLPLPAVSSSTLGAGEDGAVVVFLSDGAVFAYDAERDVFSAVPAKSIPSAPEADGRIRGFFPSDLTAFCDVGEGRWLAGTFSDGVYLVDPDGGSCSLLPGIPKAPVRAVVRDGRHCWIGLDGAGVILYDLAAQRVERHFVASDEEGGLPANTVSDLFLDRRGVLWVTTTSEGICFLDENQLSVKWFRHLPGQPRSLPSGHVSAILEDRDGGLWFGTDRGLCRYVPGTDSWQTYRHRDSENILALAEDSKGNVWAGGYGVPVFQVSPGGRMTTFPDSPSYVFSLCSQSDTVWAGGVDPLCLYAGESFRPGGPQDIWGLFREGNGRLWAASSTGLLRIDSPDGITSIPSLEPLAPLWCVTSDGTDLWIGHEGGLSRYGLRDDRLETYSLGEGIISIVTDAQGIVWAASGGRLYRLDPARNVPSVVNNYLGLGPVQFNNTAATRLRDGTLVFGTGDGAFQLYPESIGAATPDPVIPTLTGFRLLTGHAAEQDRILKGKSISALDRIVLPWQERSFAISFSALTFEARPRIRFSYQLEGHDPQERTSLSASTVEYPSVAPGRYVFRVRCVDLLTGEELGVRETGITVRRPAWLSGWALLLYGLLLSGAVLLFVRFRRRQILQRMTGERLDTFIRFAHELKTPVSLIKAPLAGLGESGQLSDGDRTSVETALRNTDRLMAMLNSLLDLREEGPESGKLYLEPTDLRDYLSEAVEPFLPAVRQRGIALECQVGDGLDAVLIDREKMDRIIQNLLSNAVKYTSAGSVTVSAAAEGRQWRLEVRDTGIGIPADVRSRIFNGGVRAANARDVDETGYGIGLMITRQLVLQHRGRISIQSEEGNGTAFTLTFPLEYRLPESQATVVQPAPADSSVQDPSDTAPKSRILVVEDDPEMLSYLESALTASFDVLTAKAGDEAFSVAAEQQPDLVLSDVIMPGMDGYELCRNLKQSLPTSHIPVILLTAMDDREHIILGLEAGADDYVVKPFDPQVLLARISGLLHERERLRSLVLRAGREEKKREYASRLDQEFMEKVLATVEQSYSDPDFEIDDLCRSLAMSRTAFFNKLKGITGKAPNDFIRIFRLERGAQLLSSHEFTVAEVADRVGFADPKYFSSCFRRHFGVSPSKY